MLNSNLATEFSDHIRILRYVYCPKVERKPVFCQFWDFITVRMQLYFSNFPSSKSPTNHISYVFRSQFKEGVVIDIKPFLSSQHKGLSDNINRICSNFLIIYFENLLWRWNSWVGLGISTTQAIKKLYSCLRS